MSHCLHRGSAALALATLVAGCGGKSQPEEPAPSTPVTTTWTPPANPRPTTSPAGDTDAERRARLEERIHFGYDRADLTPAAMAVLARKAELLQESPGLTLRVEGHADERGSDEYNLALGTRRAAAAKQYLVARGISGSRLEVMSYGEEQALSPGHDEAAWAMNRRAEFRPGSSISSR